MSLRQLEEHDKYYSPVISDGFMSYCYIMLFYMFMILAANAWMGLTETCVRLTSMSVLHRLVSTTECVRITPMIFTVTADRDLVEDFVIEVCIILTSYPTSVWSLNISACILFQCNQAKSFVNLRYTQIPLWPVGLCYEDFQKNHRDIRQVWGVFMMVSSLV